MTINVETGEIDKECELNRSYACSGCVNYYDEDDTVCKCGCIHYPRHFYPKFLSEKIGTDSENR